MLRSPPSRFIEPDDNRQFLCISIQRRIALTGGFHAFGIAHPAGLYALHSYLARPTVNLFFFHSRARCRDQLGFSHFDTMIALLLIGILAWLVADTACTGAIP